MKLDSIQYFKMLIDACNSFTSFEENIHKNDTTLQYVQSHCNPGVQELKGVELMIYSNINLTLIAYSINKLPRQRN